MTEKFSFSHRTDFTLQFPLHVPSTSGSYFSYCLWLFLPILLVSPITSFSILLPLEILCEGVQSLHTYGLCSVPVHNHFLYWAPAIRTLVLLVSCGDGKNLAKAPSVPTWSSPVSHGSDTILKKNLFRMKISF